MNRLLVVCLLLGATAGAWAQDSTSRTGGGPDLAARDGCENIPGQAHNSADCSRVIDLDPNMVLPNKPINEMSGADLNLLRTHRILSATLAAREMVKVSAIRLTDETIDILIRSLTAPSQPSGKIPRWSNGICPKTQGLSPEVNALIDRRIRQISAMVGAPVADEKCSLNVAVLFEANPQSALNEIAQLSPELFTSNDGPPQMKHPVQAFHLTQTSDNDGRVVNDVSATATECETIDTSLFNTEIGGLSATDNKMKPSVSVDMTKFRRAVGEMAKYCNGIANRGGRVSDGVSSAFTAVTVIASADLLKTYQPGALADYITLMALSKVPSFDACQPLPTVANLLTESCSPNARSDAVTGSDLAFLLALYRAVDRGTPAQQQGAIAREMKRALDGR